MTTFTVHVRYGQDLFEDITVKAHNEVEAIAKAQKLTTLPTRWARFIL